MAAMALAADPVDTLVDDEEEEELEEPLDPASKSFVHETCLKVLLFIEEITGIGLFPYQKAIAYRIVESLILNDGEEITALCARQSGKTETVADTLVACMILFPKLAKLFPERFGKFKDGMWVGVFAPIELQAETLFGRIVTRLTSERALDVMSDSEIDDKPLGGGKFIRLKRSGSHCRMQTANPKAKIESKSYHIVVIDEAQNADEYVVRKSIQPMLAFYNGSVVKIGTPDVVKGDFYKAIQLNKRKATRRGPQNHFEFDWRYVAKYNPNYARFIRKEMQRIGEDSDEFRLSYLLEWLLERGMFTTSEIMEGLGDPTMDIVQSWWHTPCVAGIDPARQKDSTVVTVVYVDWDRPDEFGFYEHRVLNWLELHGENWEEQYFQIVDFLSRYQVIMVGVDAQGMGDPITDRLSRLLPQAEVRALGSTRPDQSERWKHLTELFQRGRITWPQSGRAKRRKTWKRFNQQMIDLEKQYEGPHLMAGAPEEAEAHDDYPDSLALACVMTKMAIAPEVEVTESPFAHHRNRR